MSSRTRLLKEFQHLQRERDALLAQLQPHAPDVLERVPANGGWSIAQVVVHLALAEESALAYMRKKLDHGGGQPVNFVGSIRLTLLNAALALPVRWKAPPIIATVPALPWPQAVARWEAVRTAMRDAYATLPPGLEHHALFKHPLAGRMDLVQGLRFMRRHVRHHRGQVQRTLRAVA